jgi:hypothetical protein
MLASAKIHGAGFLRLEDDGSQSGVLVTAVAVRLRGTAPARAPSILASSLDRNGIGGFLGADGVGHDRTFDD